MSSTDHDGEPITAAGLEALRAELDQLEGQGRRDIAARILAARELGDLSENAEYHIAKEDQAHLETKILRLQDRLRNAVVVEGDVAAGVVTFGVPVTVHDEQTDRVQTWTIVGPTEADVKTGKLSAESPIAVALLGAKPGKTVVAKTPKGGRRLTVQSIG
jgi:transcription elongation factor GreA